MARKTGSTKQALKPDAPNTPQDEMPMSPRLSRGLLGLIVLVYLILAGAYNVITPFGPVAQHNPDEHAHLLYVQTIASGHLPVFQAGGADYEAHQPPLYYALCAPVYLAVHGGDAESTAKAVRWVSLLIGAAFILVAYCVVATLFPGRLPAALGVAGFVGWLPMNVSLSASVTNDVLTNLVVAAALWFLARIVMSRQKDHANQSMSRRDSVVLGIFLGLGVWTKTSTLLLFPTAALAFYFAVRQNLMSRRTAVHSAGLALGLGVLIGLPWLLRNQVLYGDPLAQHIFVKAFQTTTATADMMLPAYGSLTRYLTAVAQWTFASFWGGFDSMHVFWGQDPRIHSLHFYLSDSPGVVYGVLALLCLLALLGLGRLRTIDFTPPQKALLGSFAILVGMTWLVHLRFILVFFQAQGRYWYPALIPLALFFVLGWSGLLGRTRLFRPFLALFGGGMIVLNLYTLFGLLLPRFSGQ